MPLYAQLELNISRMLLCVTFVGLAIFAYGSYVDDTCTCRLIDSGWVCGTVRNAEDDVQYLSFRGIPYAKQPLRELRFKELQPAEPWDDYFNATEEGPICPQYDEVYSRLANPQKGMSEACIFANVHVPLVTQDDADPLPVFVFVHGGGFQAGSGDSDMHGPEYLVSKGMIVITFNYRLNVFGYFSMNNELFPGNNGLRDIYTLLRWVQTNVAAFGGDPSNVTLAGQSAGAASAHLVSLSNATEGLFNRLILMSGTGIEAFYDSSPSHALVIANKLLALLGINCTDPEYIHDQLISTPLDDIMKANSIIQRAGLVSFGPVVEGSCSSFTKILDGAPRALINEGRGKNIPLIIGFSSIECEYFKQRLNYLNITGLITNNPSATLPVGLAGTVSTARGGELGQRVMKRYFSGTPTLDEYLKCCTDTLFIYPAFKLAQWRAGLGGAPVYLYEFSFDSAYNVVKDGLLLKYEGGGAHVEDLTFIFRTNSMLRNQKSFPPRTRDDLMRYWMTDIVANFIKYDKPSCDDSSDWPQVDATALNYQSLVDPIKMDTNIAATSSQLDMIAFFDSIEMSALNLTTF